MLLGTDDRSSTTQNSIPDVAEQEREMGRLQQPNLFGLVKGRFGGHLI